MRVKPFLLVPLVAVALAACSTQAPVTPTTTDTSTEKPLFATDEEALAAAQTAYANYLEVSDQIARDGGANPERLKGLVSEDLYQQQADAYLSLAESGNHAGGVSSFDHLRIQQIAGGGNTPTVNAYLCLDVSNNPVISGEGSDVTPNSRESRIPLEVSFTVGKSKNLIIESSDVWTGSNFC